MPDRMMNIIKNRLKKWVQFAHHGMPSGPAVAGSLPGWRSMKACTPGLLYNPLPTATAATRTTKPSGASHSTLNHLSRPTRTRGAIACLFSRPPAQVSELTSCSAGFSSERKLVVLTYRTLRSISPVENQSPLKNSWRLSDRLVATEVFVVFTVAAMATADVFVARQKFDALDPFDLFETVLQFIAQPQGLSVHVGQGLVVHVVGQHRHVVAHLLNRMHVVVDPTGGAQPHRVERPPLGLRQRFDDVHDGLHRHPAPFGHPRPGLNAEVLGDLIVVGQLFELVQRQRNRVLHQAVDLQAP